MYEINNHFMRVKLQNVTIYFLFKILMYNDL